ncbi:MAG: universal stress protein [Pseudomonadota bacterium]
MTSLRHILAVWDGPQDAAALAAAEALAVRDSAALTLFSCIEALSDLAILARVTGTEPREMMQRLTADRRSQMEQALGGRDAEIQVASGKPFIEITREVLRRGIDLVVKRAEPLAGMQQFLFASTDQHLLRKCPCPVWLQMEDAPAAPSVVIAAVDVDVWDADEPETLMSLNQRVVEMSRQLASGPEARVHLLHAWEAQGEGLVQTFASGPAAQAATDRYVQEVESAHESALEKLIAPWRKTNEAEQAPWLVPRLVRGPARKVLAEEAARLGADLLVMGTVARTGLTGVIIGNTAEDILNHVQCSVVAVKPEGFVSPLTETQAKV